MKRCPSTSGDHRCSRPAGHDGLCRQGTHVWGYRDEPPEWLRRGTAKELLAPLGGAR